MAPITDETGWPVTDWCLRQSFLDAVLRAEGSWKDKDEAAWEWLNRKRKPSPLTNGCRMMKKIEAEIVAKQTGTKNLRNRPLFRWRFRHFFVAAVPTESGQRQPGESITFNFIDVFQVPIPFSATGKYFSQRRKWDQVGLAEAFGKYRKSWQRSLAFETGRFLLSDAMPHKRFLKFYRRLRVPRLVFFLN